MNFSQLPRLKRRIFYSNVSVQRNHLLIHRAEAQLLENETPPDITDSLIYAGNWQDAISRAIWTDAYRRVRTTRGQ